MDSREAGVGKVEKEIKGIIVAVVTPLDEKGMINQRGLELIINFLIEKGVHGLFPCGSQGEFFALSLNERKRLLDLVVEHVAGRVVVIAHTGAVATRDAVELSRHAEAAGADAVSAITPFYITPTREEIYTHYTEIAKAVSLPLFAYNNPARTGVNLLPELVAWLAHEVPNLVGLKDSSGDLTQFNEYLRICPPGFKLFMGRDSLIYAALASGAAGAVAATANLVPQLVVGIYEAVQVGDHARARELQQKLALLRRAFTLGTFPVVIKDAMEMVGLPAGRARKPILSLEGAQRDALRAVLKELGFLETH